MVCQPIGHEFEPWSRHFTFFFQSDYFRDMQQFMLDWCSEWPLVEHFFMEGRYLTLLETLETYSLTDTVKKEAIIILRLVHSSKC